MLRCSSDRRDDDIAAGILDVEERRRPPLATLASGRREQQHGNALAHVRADAAAGQPEERDVETRDDDEEHTSHRTTLFGATVMNASSTIPAISSQSMPSLSRTPSQPRCPTYGGMKNFDGSASTSSCWSPGGAAHQIAKRPSAW